MTPATGWNEADYYKASRAARAAWQKTNQQLQIGGLEESGVAAAADGGSACAPALLEPAVWRRSPVAPSPGRRARTQTTGPDRLSPEDDGQAQRRSR